MEQTNPLRSLVLSVVLFLVFFAGAANASLAMVKFCGTFTSSGSLFHSEGRYSGSLTFESTLLVSI